MEIVLVIPLLVSLVFALFMIPKWIKKCRQTDLLWEDMNKFDKPRNVAASGGIVVLLSFVLGVLTYISIRTFYLQDSDGITIKIFSILCMVLILGIVGLTDDFLGWKYKGLSKRFRLFLALFAAVPLMVVNAGSQMINLPFAGLVNLGLFYPLFIIPLGVVGAATTYNFLAGFNGLEASQGIIILSFLSLMAYLTGNSWLGLIGIIMVAALFVFYFYNKVPAKVFPGDSLTYSVGAVIAAMAIIGNFEKIAVFVFIPYIIEVILKLRGKLVKSSFGEPLKDGSLKLKYNKIYGLTHFGIYLLNKLNIKATEKRVVWLINGFQILICLLALLIFGLS